MEETKQESLKAEGGESGSGSPVEPAGSAGVSDGKGAAGGRGRGRGKRKPPRNPINLRPCEVCGAKASGLHFGAITCEACKSFFRRTCLKNLTYTCFGDKPEVACSIRLVKGTASPCPACRFERCRQLGMSLDASKKGRYTHEMRAETINSCRNYWEGNKDVKKPRISEATSTTTSLHEKSSSVPEASSSSSFSQDQKLHLKTTASSITGHQQLGFNTEGSPPQSTPHCLDDIKLQNFNTISNIKTGEAPLQENGQTLGSGFTSRSTESQMSGTQTPATSTAPKSAAVAAASGQITISPDVNPMASGPRVIQELSFMPFSTHHQQQPDDESLRSLLCDNIPSSSATTDTVVSDVTPDTLTSSGDVTSDDIMVALETLQEELESEFPDVPNELNQLNKIIAEVVSGDADLDGVIEQTITAFDKQNFITRGFLAKVPQLQHKFLNEREERRRLFGIVEPLPRDEHSTLLEETGIDIDGRLDFFQDFLSSLEPFVRQMINYLKCVPGFNTLCIQDRLAILKNTKVEQITTVFFSTFNAQEAVMTSPLLKVTKTVDAKIISQLHEPGFFPEVQAITARMQDLELTDHEYAMLSAVCIMQPNACSTDEGTLKCTQIQTRLRSALERLISRRLTGVRLTETVHSIKLIELRFMKFSPLGNMSIEGVVEKYQGHLKLTSPLTVQWIKRV